MKTVFVLLLSLLGASAQAGFYCESTPKDMGGEHVSLSNKNGIYQVSHWGNSRNSYLADYKETSSQGTRFGHSSKLTKVSDHSTWKDMPESLELNYYVDGNQYILSGLGGNYAWFSASECKDTSSSAPFSEAVSTQCTVPPQNDCSHSPKRLCCDCFSGQLSCY